MIYKPDRVDTDLIPIPRDLYEIQKFVTSTADVMFVNGISFLATLSRKIRFFTVEHISFCTTVQKSSYLAKIVNIYKKVYFTVWFILMDMEFEKVSDDMELVQVNTIEDVHPNRGVRGGRHRGGRGVQIIWTAVGTVRR